MNGNLVDSHGRIRDLQDVVQVMEGRPPLIVVRLTEIIKADRRHPHDGLVTLYLLGQGGGGREQVVGRWQSISRGVNRRWQIALEVVVVVVVGGGRRQGTRGVMELPERELVADNMKVVVERANKEGRRTGGSGGSQKGTSKVFQRHDEMDAG